MGSEPSRPDKPSLPSPDVPRNDNSLPSPPSKPDKQSLKPTGPKEKKHKFGIDPKKSMPVMNSYNPLSNKEIIGISERILKKNFNLGEEGYDIARDEGRVKPSKDKKDGTSYPPSEEMKRTQKKNKGPSALEIVKKKYKGQIMDVDKKKKDKK